MSGRSWESISSNTQREKKIIIGFQEENGGEGGPKCKSTRGAGSEISQSTVNQDREQKVPVADPMHPSPKMLLTRLTLNEVTYT